MILVYIFIIAFAFAALMACTANAGEYDKEMEREYKKENY